MFSGNIYPIVMVWLWGTTFSVSLCDMSAFFAQATNNKHKLIIIAMVFKQFVLIYIVIIA